MGHVGVGGSWRGVTSHIGVGGVGHEGVSWVIRGGWVMKGWGGSCWGGVGWLMKGWAGS